MADVILVQPIFGHWDSLRTAPTLPLGLIAVANLVSHEFDVKIIDERIDPDWKNTLKNELAKKPKLVGIRTLTGNQIKHALEIARVVRENSDVPIVWGGVHPSITPEQTLKHPLVDYIVFGEGEATLLELTRCIADKKSPDNVKGLWFEKDGKALYTGDRDFVNLDELDLPPYHLIDIKKYLPLEFGKPTLYIESSRGCPHNCIFCYNKYFHRRKWRGMSPERFIEVLTNGIKISGAEHVYLVDENSFVDMKRMLKIVEEMKKIDITWTTTGGHIGQMYNLSDDQLKQIEESGCLRMYFGVETGSPKVLKKINKDLDLVELIAFNKRLKDYNIIPRYSFMTGLPFETKKDLMDTADLILNLIEGNPKASITALGIYTPYPGSELFEEISKNGFKEPKNLEEWGNMLQEKTTSPWISNKRKKELEALYYLSFFIDSKAKDFVCTPMINFFSSFYRPIAKFRLKHHFFSFMPERLIARKFMESKC
jgi:anaerobic magnesium-protoporphyrin IX monomethyl ester cyclase